MSADINGPLIPKVYDTYWPTADFQTLRQSFFRLSRRIQFFLGNYFLQFCFHKIKISGGLKKGKFPNKIELDQIDVSEQAG